jgi:hypothetical protein
LTLFRNIHEVDLDIRLAGTPPAIREKLFSSLLQEDKLSNIKSLTFNVKGDWDNHEIFQVETFTSARFISFMLSLQNWFGNKVRGQAPLVSG